MNRRNTLKTIAAVSGGIAGLSLVEWKWHIVDDLLHPAFFSRKEQALLTSIADTIIPAGPAQKPGPSGNNHSGSIGALSTGTDQYLIKVIEKCYESELHEQVKLQLAALDEQATRQFGDGFTNCSQPQREELLLTMAESENASGKEFFELMKKETITGFTTAREVMVDYLEYKVAPGVYHGCSDVLT